jgi:hypothetical protein
MLVESLVCDVPVQFWQNNVRDADTRSRAVAQSREGHEHQAD